MPNMEQPKVQDQYIEVLEQPSDSLGSIYHPQPGSSSDTRLKGSSIEDKRKTETSGKLHSRQRNENANVNTRRKQVNAVHGHIYQLKLLMLFLYRGVTRKYSFRLGTEIKEAKKFDDLVFEYTQDDKKVYRLLQAKHRLEEFKKIRANSLLTDIKCDYSLIKFFFSYQDSKKAEFFKDGVIKDVTICTNVDLDFEDLEGAQIRIERIEDKDEILDVKSDQKEPTRYRFSEDIAPLLKLKLQDYSKATEYSDDEIKDFLHHLVFAVNQPNEEELGKIIKKEIGKEFDFITTENIYNKFFITMLNWLQGKERGLFLSYEEGKEFFEEARRGLPIWFGVRGPVESFVGRAEQLDNLHGILQAEDKTVICISGLGGVGKSELARKYINEYSEKYDNRVVWIIAEKYQDLARSFRRLAFDKLRISPKNTKGDEKEMRSIVEDVYSFFSIGKSLFVFDNAEKYESENETDHGIDKFLPSVDNYNWPSILITSRNQIWPRKIKVLQLDAFNEEEAINFVKKSLNIENNTQEKDIKELLEKLQHFPLALQQAVAYIRMQDAKLKNLGLEFKISNYLERFSKKTKELLNFEFRKGSDNDYTKTTFTTWNVTLDALGQKENGNDALEILNIISYFLPENVPTKIFLSLISDAEKLGSAIELLKEYSMVVNVGHGELNIHRLVQQITRIKLEEQNKEEKVLTEGLRLFDKANVDSKNVDHAISVWNYSSKYSELPKKFFYVSSCISDTLIDNDRDEEAYLFGLKISEFLSALPSDNLLVQVGLLATEYNVAGALLDKGKHDMGLKIFQKVFDREKINFGPDYAEIFSTKAAIGLTFFKQAKYNEALKYFREIYDFSKTKLVETHPITILLKQNIAEILLSQGLYDDALQISQELYKSLGENHSQTVKTKNNIASAFMHQGKYNEALQMVLQIQNIQEATLKKDYPSILRTMDTKASILSNQGKYSDALLVYQEMINIGKMFLGKNHPDTLRFHYHVAKVLNLQRKYDKALEIFQDVFDKLKGTVDSDHPYVLRAQHGIALTLAHKGKYSKALPIVQEILNKRKVDLGNDHPDILDVCNTIATIFFNLGEIDEALRHYLEILMIQKCRLEENHPDIKNYMDRALLKKKEYDKALQLFQEVFNTSQTSLPGHPIIFAAKNNLALVLLCQNKNAEALEIFREVLDSQKAILGEDHYGTTIVRKNIATILLAEGRHTEALDIFRVVLKGLNKVLGPEHQETLRISETILSLSMTADLLIAVKGNVFEKTKNLIQNGGDVNTKDKDDRTPLHFAVNNGNIDIVNILLKNRADATQITNNKGNTPLHIATSKGRKEIVKVLLQHIVENKLNNLINAQTTTGGNTSLHIAAKNGFLEIVKSLLKHGATYNIENKEGKTPLDLAKDENIIYILRLVDVLFEDAKKGNSDIITKLRALKPDDSLDVMNARNNQGNKLLQALVTNKHENIASKLLEMFSLIPYPIT